MTYDFQSRLRKVSDRFKNINYEAITYTRDGESITIAKASPILHEAPQIVVGVSVSRLEIQDWAIDCEDIEFGDGVNEPMPNDMITRANGDQFRPVDMGPGNPSWRFTTSARDRVLLHTVKTGER